MPGKSYNDMAWDVMMSRIPHHNLPQQKGRPETTNPMPADIVPADWSGKSAEDLGQPPSIPPEVIARPRAYLKPPSLPVTRNSESLKQRGSKLAGDTPVARTAAPATVASGELPVKSTGREQFGVRQSRWNSLEGDIEYTDHIHRYWHGRSPGVPRFGSVDECHSPLSFR